MRAPVVLLLESDAIARHALAEFLRACGYRVVEAASTDEAYAFFAGRGEAVDTALLDAQAAGAQTAFALAHWLRANRPQTQIAISGVLERAAHKVGELCENGPTLAKPYDHAHVLDLIKRLRAERDRSGGAGAEPA